MPRRPLAALMAGLAAALIYTVDAMAADNRAHLTYVGYLGGAPVLSLGANITVPEGTKPQDGVYIVSADIATTGNLAMLYPFTQSLKASGALQGHRPHP